MTQTYSTRALLKETYDLLSVPGSGSSAEADRKIALCEKIRLWLIAERGAVMGGSGGGAVNFGGAAGGAAGGDTFTASIGSNGFGGAAGGGGGCGDMPDSVKPDYCLVLHPDNTVTRMKLPSDMPETGILLDINGKSRTVTKAELQRMIEDGTV